MCQPRRRDPVKLKRNKIGLIILQSISMPLMVVRYAPTQPLLHGTSDPWQWEQRTRQRGDGHLDVLVRHPVEVALDLRIPTQQRLLT